MLRTTFGRLAVNSVLPDDLVDHNRTIDKAGLQGLLRDVALKHPEQYREISKKLADIGRHAATRSGGNSFSLLHLTRTPAGTAYKASVQAKLARILNDDRLDKDPRKRDELIVRAVGEGREKLVSDLYKESLAENNPLALQILSGARGNPMNLADLRVGSGLYADHRDRALPIPVLSSYSEGLQPIEYWAGTYGARKGVLAVKFAVQDAGFLSKQLNQAAHRVMVVDDEDPKPSEFVRGLPVRADDPHNEGSLLAQDTGPYKRNTALTPKILQHLQRLGKERLLVRSPIVGGSADGGVYARDVGIRERGTLPGVGEMVGLTAAQALSEPISQGTLGAKHSGGVVGMDKAVSGFDAIDQSIQIPEKFKGGAAHAQADGRVERIEDAAAGGKHVWVGDKKHYVGQGFDLKVKSGDEVEAGDAISEGLPNHAPITKHKGVGEGRRYFTEHFMQTMRDAGMKPHRRNIELLAKGLINHVRLTDEHDGYLPDEVLPYSTIENTWEPREGHKRTAVGPQSLGRYLESPVLHHTIGTKIRPSMVKELKEFGVKEILTHHEPPPFEAEAIRGMYALQHDPDWAVRQYGSGLKGGFTEAVHRGRKSDEASTSFVPGLARGVDFGRVGPIRTPEPGTLSPTEGQPFGGDDMKKKKPDLGALNLATPKASPRSFFGLGSLFKQSSDQVTQLTEARAMAVKMAGLMKGAEPRGAGLGPQPDRAGHAAPPAAPGAAPAAAQPPAQAPVPGGAAPPPGAPGGAAPQHLQPGGGVPRPAPPPVQPAHAPPQSQHPSSPPGQPHYLRQQMAGFATSFAQPSHTQEAAPGASPAWMQNPEMAASFVQQGHPDDHFGQLTRLGSLYGMRDMATLTGGQRYDLDPRMHQGPPGWRGGQNEEVHQNNFGNFTPPPPTGPQTTMGQVGQFADNYGGIASMLPLPFINDIIEGFGLAGTASEHGSSGIVRRGDQHTDDLANSVLHLDPRNGPNWWSTPAAALNLVSSPTNLLRNGEVIGGALQNPGRANEIRGFTSGSIQDGTGTSGSLSMSPAQSNPAPGAVQNRDTRQVRDHYAMSPTVNAPRPPLQPAVAARFQQFLNGERVSTLEHTGRESWTDPVTGTVVTQGAMEAYQAQQRARPSTDPRSATTTGGMDMRNDAALALDELTGNSALQRLREQHRGEWRFDTGFGADLAVAARQAFYGPHIWAGGQITEGRRAEGAADAAQQQSRTQQQQQLQARAAEHTRISPAMANLQRTQAFTGPVDPNADWTDPATGITLTPSQRRDWVAHREQQNNQHRIANEQEAFRNRWEANRWTRGHRD